MLANVPSRAARRAGGLAVVVLLLGWQTPAAADSAFSSFNLFFENDLFGDSDAQYTNGVKLSWTSPDLTHYRDSPHLPAWSHRLIDLLPFINEPGLQRNVVLSLGQNIYTPEDTVRRDLVREDRPYAGWLYGGAAFHNKSLRRLDVVEVQVGVVGPWSLAEQAQALVHEVRGLDKPNGWRHQLDNEPGINIIAERRWRAARVDGPGGLGADLITHVGGSLGNVQTHLNGGVEMRAGWNVPFDFGTTIIRPGGESNSPAEVGSTRVERSGVHLFASLDMRVVGRNIFLDGNTFGGSHSVDSKLLVADVAAGVSVAVAGARVSFARVMRTRQFHGEPNSHHFGSVTLSYSF